MAKFTPKTIQNLANQNTAVASINYNFDTLMLLIDTLLSRDGQAPNAMLSNLDMNNNRILNLPVPISPTEPARHGDIQQYVDEAEAAAEVSVEASLVSLAAAAEAEADLEEFQSEYLGAFPSDPVVDKNGNAIKDGAFYYNSTDGTIRVYSVRYVKVLLDTVVVNTDIVLADAWITLPVTEFENLQDVDIETAVNGAFLTWSGSAVVPVTLTADLVPQDNTAYTGDSVQDALDDLLNRTILGVFDIFAYAQGLPGDSEEFTRLIASRTFVLPAGATQSQARLRQAPTAGNFVVSIQKNGVQVGTITFASGAVTGVFAVAGDTTFVAGDLLVLKAPTITNTSVRDVSITLACRR